MNTLTLENNRIAARTKYDPGLIVALKQVDPRARWESDRKAWTYPAEPYVAQSLMSLLGIDPLSLPEELRKLVPKQTVQHPEPNEDEIQELREMWPGTSTPYRHQLVGLHLLLKHDYFGLFWEMGCGKSAPTCARIALGLLGGQISRVLIICPKSALTVWPAELERHGSLPKSSCAIAMGDKEKRRKVFLSKTPIVVTNFEIVRMDEPAVQRGNFDLIVVDESHRIKTLNSETSKAVRRISRSASYRYALSGTPAPNSPIDVCGTLCYLDGGEQLGNSITAIRARFCVMGGFNAHQVVGYKNLIDLERITGSMSQRVTKEECLDLPPKIYETRHVELSREAKKIYGELKNEALAVIESARGSGTLTVQNILTESTRLLQVCGGFLPDDNGQTHELKNNHKMDCLKDLLGDLGQSQAIIWANFVTEVEAIAKVIDGSAAWTPEARSVVHHGRLDHKDRTRAIDLFKSGEVQFFISTPQSAREAITLVNASTVIYYSRGWNLLDWLQSQDRAHRIGQDKPVTIICLLATGTVDERIQEALEKKRTLQEIILGGGSVL